MDVTRQKQWVKNNWVSKYVFSKFQQKEQKKYPEIYSKSLSLCKLKYA